MQAEARQARIFEYLERVEFASLDELANLVEASASTVRRDLDALEEMGRLRRTHGGARLVQTRSEEFVFAHRDTIQSDLKEAIGMACARLIEPNQSVIMDAGSTVFHVAKFLENKCPQIITNSLPITNLFAGSNKVELVVSGGVIYPRLGVLVGPLAVETFAKMHADVAIMSSGGITGDGITNSHALLIEIQRQMIRAAKKVIFCLDSSKFDRRSPFFLCHLEEMQVLVTDDNKKEEMSPLLHGKSIEWVVASTPSTQTNTHPELA